MLESHPLELVEPETKRATSDFGQFQTTCYCRAEIKRIWPYSGTTRARCVVSDVELNSVKIQAGTDKTNLPSSIITYPRNQVKLLPCGTKGSAVLCSRPAEPFQTPSNCCA